MNQYDFDWLHVLCQDMDRARSLTVSLMVKYGEWDQLVKLRCYPSDYLHDLDQFLPSYHTGIESFKFDYQITELLRKCEDLPLKSVDPKAAAIQTFFDAEEQCLETNIRLRTLRNQTDTCISWRTRYDTKWEVVVNYIRSDLVKILGKIPDRMDPKFSSGSTFDDRRFILPQDKMSNRPTCTRSAYSVIEPFWAHTGWCHGLLSEYPDRSLPKFILGNRFTLVPKDALTLRGICVEPSLNVTYQLSVGSVIRSRLRSYGIDLKFGQHHHQKLVKEASLTLDAGTIDIKTASDTVSYEVVKLLLPEPWFDLLDALRSPYTKIDGTWVKNQKFSSMGNGFTFELETLIFFAIARAVNALAGCESKIIKVYGDDIIVSTSLASKLVNVLRFFGFKTNDRKTFIDNTPFRESCGSDYYAGHPVRGYYVSKIPKEPFQWIKLANGVRRMAQYDLDAFGDLYRYKRSWLRIINHVPSRIQRLRGPSLYGDLLIHDNQWGGNTRFRRGVKEIQILKPQFERDAYTSYDRKFWTRNSILYAAATGALTGAGDRHILNAKTGLFDVERGLQKKSRYEPIGYQLKWVQFNDLSLPEPGGYSYHLNKFLGVKS